MPRCGSPRHRRAPTCCCAGCREVATMSLALLTDLYELNMAAVYLRRGMLAPATFSLFVRQLPPGRGFLVAAGLEDCLEFLEEFQFSDADLDYLRREVGYPADTLAALRELRFTGDVWAVPEGRVMLATVIATKAVRCRLAAAGRHRTALVAITVANVTRLSRTVSTSCASGRGAVTSSSGSLASTTRPSGTAQTSPVNRSSRRAARVSAG